MLVVAGDTDLAAAADVDSFGCTAAAEYLDSDNVDLLVEGVGRVEVVVERVLANSPLPDLVGDYCELEFDSAALAKLQVKHRSRCKICLRKMVADARFDKLSVAYSAQT